MHVSKNAVTLHSLTMLLAVPNNILSAKKSETKRERARAGDYMAMDIVLVCELVSVFVFVFFFFFSYSTVIIEFI